MVKDFGKPSPGSQPAQDGGEDETRAALDDPLLELARIVHQNNQTGGSVTSNRVGNTDYFADLDEVIPGFSREARRSGDQPDAQGRIEPDFTAFREPVRSPVEQQPVEDVASEEYFEEQVDTPADDGTADGDGGYGAQPAERSFIPTDPFVASLQREFANDLGVDLTEEQPAEPPVRQPASRGAPQIRLSPEDLLGDGIGGDFLSAEEFKPETPVQAEVPSQPAREEAAIPGFMANAFTASKPRIAEEAPSAGYSQTQEFGADFASAMEDELIGAFRQSFGPQSHSAGPVAASDETVDPQEEDQVEEPYAAAPEPMARPQGPAPVVPPLEMPKASFETSRSFLGEPEAPVQAQVESESPQPDVKADPLDILARMASRPSQAAVSEAAPRAEAPRSAAPHVAQERPQQMESAPVELSLTNIANEDPASSQEEEFDSLFAELDPPKREAPAEPVAKPQVASGQEEMARSYHQEPRFDDFRASRASAPAVNDDIDDMAWPAAASAVPQLEDDETPPPPEGYDLDAVAKAMQESDPSLDGSGVLPPHPSKQRAAAPAEKPKSRKGMLAAAAVLGVAVLGGGAFMFMDSDGIEVPNGAPPIIAGIQGALKVMPDATAADSDPDGSKLIYDRVGGTEDTSRERLILPETPKPAELPPAPENATGTDPLVPGAPKRVRTVVVRPDGTIVPGGETDGSTPRIISTVPVTINPGSQPAPAPAAPTNPVQTTAVDPAVVAPANGGQPAIVTTTPAGAVPVATVPVTPEGVAAEVVDQSQAVSVTPRRKPAAPVQVATAPVVVTPVQTQTNPAPTRPSGPLDLSNPGPAPVVTQPVSTGGSIAAGTYVVQVTSQRSEGAARDAYQGLQRRYPGVLGSFNAVIVRADLGDRGTFYRARIPANSRAQAISLCESLKSAGGDCFVRQN